MSVKKERKQEETYTVKKIINNKIIEKKQHKGFLINGWFGVTRRTQRIQTK